MIVHELSIITFNIVEGLFILWTINLIYMMFKDMMEEDEQ